MTTIRDAAARGFSQAADAYERGRPDYPAAAVDRIATDLDLGPGRRVLDLAAGTGKLTRLLVPTGADIVAVEPVAEMRRVLRETVPTAEVLEGVAESIPLPNESVDAVVVGQAFHWFDAIRAISEIHRVLRPGGQLAMVWNVHDASVPWVRRLDEVIDRLDNGNPRYRTNLWRETFARTRLFEEPEPSTFAHVQRGDPDTIVDRVASISYVGAAEPADRDAVLRDVRALLATDPGTRDRAEIELPYRTDVFVARRTDAARSATEGLVVAVNTSAGGVPKRPVERVWVDRLGLRGDRHSKPEPIHGGPDQAVCLYAQEAIERLRPEGHEAFPGAFGENVTVAGLDCAVLRAGDRIEIGDEGLVLELTDYADPCQTIARWLIGRRIARISATMRPEDARWYARVLSEGPVPAGDRVRRS